jgi:hypothetical protein
VQCPRLVIYIWIIRVVVHPESGTNYPNLAEKWCKGKARVPRVPSTILNSSRSRIHSHSQRNERERGEFLQPTWRMQTPVPTPALFPQIPSWSPKPTPPSHSSYDLLPKTLIIISIIIITTCIITIAITRGSSIVTIWLSTQIFISSFFSKYFILN